MGRKTLAQRLWEADAAGHRLKTPIEPQSVDDILAYQRSYIAPAKTTPVRFYVAVWLMALLLIAGTVAVLAVLVVQAI